MFDNFLREFKVTDRNKVSEEIEVKVNLQRQCFGVDEFLDKFSGATFNNGLYRIHNFNEIEKWTNILIEAFPQYSGRIKCFSYDWLGRQFALDFERLDNGEPMVLMFEIGTGEVLEIPTSFYNFHEEELIEYKDAALAESLFFEWRRKSCIIIKHNQCVAYKIPLFLGGEDEINNLELSDMEVYWGINSQLI